MNVLVIDDDSVASSFLALQLKMLGKTPHMASSGKAGLEKLAQAPVELILLDCQMPEMDGFETAAAIRQSGFQGPVIGLTAETTSDIRQRCLEAGMTEYECKPIDVARLKKLLEQHLSAPAGGRDPLAKCRMLAEKSGFPGLAAKMAGGFIKSSEEALARNDLDSLHKSALQFGAEDFADQVSQAQRNNAPASLSGAWERLKKILQEI